MVIGAPATCVAGAADVEGTADPDDPEAGGGVFAEGEVVAPPVHEASKPTLTASAVQRARADPCRFITASILHPGAAAPLHHLSRMRIVVEHLEQVKTFVNGHRLSGSLPLWWVEMLVEAWPKPTQAGSFDHADSDSTGRWSVGG
jgi:hypothetical protein